MIKNIIFDIGNVLLEWNPEKLLKTYLLKNDEIQQIKEVVFESKEWCQLDEGILETEKAYEIFLKRLPDYLKEKAKEILYHWQEVAVRYDDMVELIKKLKERKYQIYILSNTNRQIYQYIQSLDKGKYIDGYIISAIEKQVKPNRNIYETLLERYQLLPEECFFIDDKKENIQTAIEVGMNGFIFQHDNIEELYTELQRYSIL